MMKLNDRGSWSLIGLLVVVVIIVVAGVYLFGKMGPSTVKNNSPLLDSKSKKETVVGKSIDTAKASACQQQLIQIRQGIQAYKASEGTEANPKSLKDLQLGVRPDFFQCPMTNQPYTYDPATGAVKCPTHSTY